MMRIRTERTATSLLLLASLLLAPVACTPNRETNKIPSTEATKVQRLDKETAAFKDYALGLFSSEPNQIESVGDTIACRWDLFEVTRPAHELAVFQAVLRGTLSIVESKRPWFIRSPEEPREGDEAQPPPPFEDIDDATLWPLPDKPVNVRVFFQSKDGLTWDPNDVEHLKRLAELCGAGPGLDEAEEADVPEVAPPPTGAVAPPPTGSVPSETTVDCDATPYDFTHVINLRSSQHHALPANHIENQPLNDQEDTCVQQGLDAFNVGDGVMTGVCRRRTEHGVELTAKWKAHCEKRAGPYGDMCYAVVTIPDDNFDESITQGSGDHKHSAAFLFDSCAFTTSNGQVTYADICNLDASVAMTKRPGVLGDELGLGYAYAAMHRQTDPVASPLVGWGPVGVIINPGSGNVADYYRMKGYVADMGCDSRGRAQQLQVRGPTDQKANERPTR